VVYLWSYGWELLNELPVETVALDGNCKVGYLLKQ
jgi:hypothetical protein